MAHQWNNKVNRHVAHEVTCQLCGVFVERVFVDGKGVNYNTPLGGERSRGLAPKCPGKIVVEDVDPNQTTLFDLNNLALVEEPAPEPADEQLSLIAA